MNKQDEINDKKSGQVLVRLNEREYSHALKLAKPLGGSVQNLFRKLIMGASVPTVVLDPEGARSIISELKRIGNNINQIARQMNEGISRGWYDEFEKAAAELSTIENLLRKHLGYC